MWAKNDDPDDVRASVAYDRAESILETVEVPDDLACDPELGAVARAMLAIRAASDGGDAAPFGASFAAVARLARITGADAAESAMRRLGILCRRGYVTRTAVGVGAADGRKSQPSEWIWYDPPRPEEATWYP